MSKEALKLAQHWSDCAVHSEPAYPKGKCDCGGIVAAADYTALSDKYVALSDKYVALSDKYVALKAQPAQEPVACKHEWFRTGAMEPRECRCIKCGAWNTTPPQRTERTEQNFCPRCGKRTNDIHTCTPQRPWVGLTAEEAAECWTTSATHTWRNFEAKLKEKNT